MLQHITNPIATKGKLMHSIHEALRYFREAGYQTALATSSSHRVIVTALNELSLWCFFNVISNVDDEPHGKLYPAIYLTALCELNPNANQCLVIKDSYSGFCTVQVAGIPMAVVVEDSRQGCYQAVVGRH